MSSNEDAQLCLRCGRPVVVSRHHYETYERMHWICFHLEYEHGDHRDPDSACGDPGCPARAFDPKAPPSWDDDPSAYGLEPEP
jgi:hypothetical protein